MLPAVPSISRVFAARYNRSSVGCKPSLCGHVLGLSDTLNTILRLKMVMLVRMMMILMVMKAALLCSSSGQVWRGGWGVASRYGVRKTLYPKLGRAKLGPSSNHHVAFDILCKSSYQCTFKFVYTNDVIIFKNI